MARAAGAVLAIVAGDRRRSPSDIATASARDLDRKLAFPAELRVSIATEAAVVVGAFGRHSGTAAPAGMHVLRRGSGGPPVVLGPETIHLMLSLETPDALTSCDEKRIVNRYVRPLLRAITAHSKSQAHFFGRDWVSLEHRPVAWVGFGHDASTGRTLFESFVAVRSGFAPALRPAFLGRAPATLEELTGRPVDADRLAEAIVAAYGREAEIVPVSPAVALLDRDPLELEVDHVPWAAVRQEAIGVVGAGRDARGVFRVGGDLLVSRDALARLEARLAAGPEEDEIGRIVDETLAAPGVALDGVRSLASLRDVIAEAL